MKPEKVLADNLISESLAKERVQNDYYRGTLREKESDLNVGERNESQEGEDEGAVELVVAKLAE